MLHVLQQALPASFERGRSIPERCKGYVLLLDPHCCYEVRYEIIDELDLVFVGDQRHVVQGIDDIWRKLSSMSGENPMKTSVDLRDLLLATYPRTNCSRRVYTSRCLCRKKSGHRNAYEADQ